MKQKSQRQIWRSMYEVNFGKRNFGKKVKSPLSMNFWRISTSKYRGTLQKMGYCAHTPARSPGPCYMQGPEIFLKKNVTFFFEKKVKKNVQTGCDPRPVARRPLPDQQSPVPGDPWLPTSERSAVGDRPSAGAPLCPPPAPIAQPPCPQNFAHAANSSLLAAAHARLAQTSPSNFKHP
jgi:hypothetical protein